MPRKSKWRSRLTGRWLRWALFRLLARLWPEAARRYNVPLRRLPARAAAGRIFADRVEKIVFDLPEPLFRDVLWPSRLTDAGDTSGYEARRTTAFDFVGLVEDCDVNGCEMRFLHRPTFGLLDYAAEPLAPNQIKPKRLAARPARREAVYALASYTSNYYHFLMDTTLPLIGALRRFGDEIGPVVLAVQREAPGFAWEIARALQAAFPRLELETVDAGAKLEGARALFVHRAALAREWVPFDLADVEALRRALWAHYRLPPPGPRAAIYVSRGRAKLRGLRTEEGLTAALGGRGFEIFTPCADRHAEQLRAFGAARLIVAVHGAALANLLFAPPGATVVELFAANHVKSPYLWLARGLGLRYAPVIGGDADARQAFSLDPAAVLAALETLT